MEVTIQGMQTRNRRNRSYWKVRYTLLAVVGVTTPGSFYTPFSIYYGFFLGFSWHPRRRYGSLEIKKIKKNNQKEGDVMMTSIWWTWHWHRLLFDERVSSSRKWILILGVLFREKIKNIYWLPPISIYSSFSDYYYSFSRVCDVVMITSNLMTSIWWRRHLSISFTHTTPPDRTTTCSREGGGCIYRKKLRELNIAVSLFV